jgi:hypothetical protein
MLGDLIAVANFLVIGLVLAAVFSLLFDWLPAYVRRHRP